MNGVLLSGAALAAGVAGALGFEVRAANKSRARLRTKLRERALPRRAKHRSRWTMMGALEELTRILYVGSTRLIFTRRAAKGGSTAGPRSFFAHHSKMAGCAGRISSDAFCEMRNRLSVGGFAIGAFVGLLFSAELGAILSIALCLLARTAPDRALKDEQAKRAHEAQRCLSEMLEVVALGLRSGLTFDRSFALYGQHFTSGFAHSCALAHRRWSLGLSTREEALRDLSQSYDCEQLARVVETIIRGLRLGTALVGGLEEAAAQTREAHKAAVEERVAKAPVKMMIPTGTLILPAMLLLVLGPILLELSSGF